MQDIVIAHFGHGLGMGSVLLCTHVGGVSFLQDDHLTNTVKLSDNIKQYKITVGTVAQIEFRKVIDYPFNFKQNNVFVMDNDCIADVDDKELLKIGKHLH